MKIVHRRSRPLHNLDTKQRGRRIGRDLERLGRRLSPRRVGLLCRQNRTRHNGKCCECYACVDVK